MTRDVDEKADLLKDAEFIPIAHMMRMSVRDISQSLDETMIVAYNNSGIGEFPDEKDAEEINNILWKLFDSRVSHLQYDDEITKSINKQEFTVHKNKVGKIDALIQAYVQPKKFYINQIYNASEKEVIHTMLRNRLKEYVDQGGKYVYAWVDRDNIASLKFHAKYGLKHDGMWNLVYALERNA